MVFPYPLCYCGVNCKVTYFVFYLVFSDAPILSQRLTKVKRMFIMIVISFSYDKGDFYLGKYEVWYCTPDESFWTDSQVVKNENGEIVVQAFKREPGCHYGYSFTLVTPSLRT